MLAEYRKGAFYMVDEKKSVAPKEKKPPKKEESDALKLAEDGRWAFEENIEQKAIIAATISACRINGAWMDAVEIASQYADGDPLVAEDVICALEDADHLDDMLSWLPFCSVPWSPRILSAVLHIASPKSARSRML